MSNQDSKRLKRYEIVIMPLVLIVISSIMTYLITNSQNKNTIRVTETQIAGDKLLARSQITSSENIAASENQIKLLEIFKEFIGDNTPQKKEIAVRILSSIDKKLGLDITFALATTTSESYKVRKLAFDVGMNIDRVVFSQKILNSLNMVYTEDTLNNPLEELNNFDSGYPVLIEAMYDLLNTKELKGNTVPFSTINGRYNQIETDVTEVSDEKLKDAIIQAWKDENKGSYTSDMQFEDLVKNN